MEKHTEHTARKFLTSKFVLILILFCMPFINVSCQGMIDIPLSGMDLALGETVEFKNPIDGSLTQETFSPEPLAIVALLCACVGLITGLMFSSATKLIPPITGAIGAGSLVLLQLKLNQDIAEKNDGLLVIQYLFGYWAVCALFIVAVAMGIYFATKSHAKESSESTPQ